MGITDKPLWVGVLGIVLAVIAFSCGGQTDEQRFDRLQIGMSVQEVNSILLPSARKFHAGATPNLSETQNIRFNGNMILSIRNGRLVHKEWTGSASR